MDDKGYTFTPIAVLLVIPIMILAASYGDIANEINNLSQIIIGGDVTYTTAKNVITLIEETTYDSGRSAAYNATRYVIDTEATLHSNPFLPDSRSFIKRKIADSLNRNVIGGAKAMEAETGRQIYIDNIPINNYTNEVFTEEDIIIYQTDPYGFYIEVKQGIPITVVQADQNFTGYTPDNIVKYVPIIGLEDPYVWINSKHRRSNVFDRYRYYDSVGNTYNFDVSHTNSKLNNLWDCLNGTNNTSGVGLRPYYFPDSRGLTFFDRLENRTPATSLGNDSAKLSTFIIGEPLYEEFQSNPISCLDHEYFAGVPGTRTIEMKNGWLRDPMNSVFYISQTYFDIFGLKSKYM